MLKAQMMPFISMAAMGSRLRLLCLGQLVLAIVSEQIGTSALKASEGFTNIVPSAFAIAGYILSFYFFGRSMRALPMGLAYALWSGLGMLIATVIGIVLFSETLHATGAIGIAMLIGGVTLLNSSPEAE
jgi:small multidrug resistance pump